MYYISKYFTNRKGENMLLKEAIEDYRQYIAITKSNGTIDYYRYYFRILKEEFGEYECSSFTNKNILSFIIARKRLNPAVSNATLNKYVRTLKTVVKYSTGIEIKFSKLKEKKKIIPTVSKVTSNKLFNYYQKHMHNRFTFRNYLFLKLLLDTGLRLSEMINIRLRDIDLNTKSIHVKVTKTDVDRFVCFTESTEQLLYKFIVTHKIMDYLFYDFKTNKKLTTSSVESFIYKIKLKLKLEENITPHKWRHTFATDFIRKGGDLETLRLLLGHSNLKTTQKYLHLSKNDIVANYMSVMR